ncbi:MAG TPA: SBBP repeat-containing protein, partial [Pyrinomonadaceae bacterium]
MKRQILTSSIRVFALVCVVTGLAVISTTHLRQADREAGRALSATDQVSIDDPPSGPDDRKIAQAYGKLPMSFEPNRGQTDESVRFLARGQGYSLFLSHNGATLSLQRYGNTGKIESQSAVRVTIDGSSESASVEGEKPNDGRSNYFIGNDPEKWRTDIPHYDRVKYTSVYDGVDLVYYGNGQQLEYDFLVRPGHDPQQIKLRFEGLETAKIDEDTGDLLLETGSGTLRQMKPFVYQEIDGKRIEIASTYAIKRDGDEYSVSFNLAAYDTTKDLVIDPILSYGTYLGGNAFDEGRSIAVDTDGNAYIVGTAASRDFPTTPGTIKPTMLPRTDAPNSFWYDAFVTKINPAGTALVFSTYFGGRNGNESGGGVALDA